MTRINDDTPPWSFFIPITLAVIVGVLAADAIRYAISIVFDGRAASMQSAEPAAPRSAAPAAPAVPEPDEPVAVQEEAAPQPDMDAQPAEEAAAVPDPVPAAGDGAEDSAAPEQAQQIRPDNPEGLRELNGSVTARAEGDDSACINGTVVNRIAGGWSQEVENNVPVRCVAITP